MIGAAIAKAEVLLRDGANTEAIAVLSDARNPKAPLVEQYELGTALLRASNATLGWDLYDLHPSSRQDQIRKLPRWDGNDCGHLIVMAEQGFGDAIQFLRFIPLAKARAEKVTVVVHDELAGVVQSSPLLHGCEVTTKTAARQRPWAKDTVWERLMSLPAKIPDARPEPTSPYLIAPPGTRFSRRLTVGVAWRGTHRKGFPSRSFPARLLGLLGGVHLVAIHRDQDVTSSNHDARLSGIHNFTDTARVIGQCDYVVTADTVTAHLAPALGVPTFICLRHVPDWRWGTPACPTQWYQHARLLFQDETQTWPPVLRAAAVVIGQS